MVTPNFLATSKLAFHMEAAAAVACQSRQRYAALARQINLSWREVRVRRRKRPTSYLTKLIAPKPIHVSAAKFYLAALRDEDTESFLRRHRNNNSKSGAHYAMPSQNRGRSGQTRAQPG
jgi:hypothetical protein